MVVVYRYDPWGRPVWLSGSMSETLGALNPFRYRGYVYDTETGLYYLRSRYYNPNWGRFLSADSILGQIGTLLQHNPFSYCSNNPVIRIDVLGEAFEVVFDLISVASSIFEVSRNPSDPGAWFALAGDFIDVVVPFVSGVGETVRLFRVGEKVVDAVDDVYDTGKTIKRIHGNSLFSNRINYGYQLYEKKTGLILKYGESKNPNLRYTKTFLEEHGYKVEIKVAGTKRGVHEWQHEMIAGYTYMAGERPPMNRSLW